MTNPGWWKHCPGIENPADISSRGATPAVLAASKFYWEGPPWLISGEEHWPKAPISSVAKSVETTPKENVEIEVSPVVVRIVKADKPEPIPSLYNSKEMEKFSELHRFVRVTA